MTYYPETDDEVVITFYGKMVPTSTGLYTVRLPDDTKFYFGVAQMDKGILGVEKIDLAGNKFLEPGLYEWVGPNGYPRGTCFVKRSNGELIYVNPNARLSDYSATNEEALRFSVDNGTLRRV